MFVAKNRSEAFDCVKQQTCIKVNPIRANSVNCRSQGIAMVALVKAGEIIELTTVVRKLEANDAIATAGRVAHQAEIYSDVSRGQHSRDIALSVVKEGNAKRALRMRARRGVMAGCGGWRGARRSFFEVRGTMLYRK